MMHDDIHGLHGPVHEPVHEKQIIYPVCSIDTSMVIRLGQEAYT